VEGGQGGAAGEGGCRVGLQVVVVGGGGGQTASVCVWEGGVDTLESVGSSSNRLLRRADPSPCCIGGG
jgi:hypothetical protein